MIEDLTTITTYCDFDWVGEPDDRLCILGPGIWFSGNLLSWSDKKQNVVSKSSCEAKYRALSSVATEALMNLLFFSRNRNMI